LATAHIHTELDAVSDASVWSMDPAETAHTLTELVRAEAKLAEVESRIADLQVVAGTLRAAIDAGCDDLVTCAGTACCPIPFAAIADGNTDAAAG
jgi:hypothetical protein